MIHPDHAQRQAPDLDDLDDNTLPEPADCRPVRLIDRRHEPELPVTWTARLVAARLACDPAAEARARRELRRLGIDVRLDVARWGRRRARV